MAQSQKITPYLWFNDNAEEAVNFYVSVFPDSKILDVTRYGDTGPGPKGAVMTLTFQLAGQRFIALNGGPQFKFTEALSLFVDCDSQAEVDALWAKLSAGGGEEGPCGWLKDKFGLSWQIIPSAFMAMVSDKDAAKSQRVMEAMMQMKKLDIGQLKAAYSAQ
ncbi:MAG TPA: VOC family protein [Myxococcaceae bacterium]|nr:VOC family protein [Myxococcaceae bacterium]